ncbi:MAG: hypothetical protein L6R40_008474 [Gallowayella cf. fulva]|nr:MAG: hypothetical protein L6R40_008474 [Xanthomendoza cf. fulva]
MALDPDPERDAVHRDERGPPKLIKFRHMTGIDTPPALRNKDRQRAARNLGVYARIVSEERKATYQYYLMSSIINASFLGQILVAATLTALGAIGGPSLAITILGSANTIIAGLQTYLKGQGLPNRIKQYQFGLRKLREYVEDRERDFSHESCKLDVDHVIADVSAMYQAVRQTAEDNTPDTYLPMEGAGKKLLGQKDNRVTPIEQLGPAGYIERATASKDVDVAWPRDAKQSETEAEAESSTAATGSLAGLSSGNRKPQNQPTVEEDDESTPLLKQGESQQAKI